jgi:HUS1 checkpoint protein
MRFKAKIQDTGLFLRVVQTIEKINKTCVIHLTQRKIQFILVCDITDGFQVWAGMNAASLFSDYNVESMNNNEISFNITLDHLQRALKSSQYAQETLVKLTKKNGIPYLSLCIETTTTQAMTVNHDIPINLLGPLQVAAFVEPTLPDPEVYIMMPPLKLLRSVVDHMKNLDDYLTMQANMAGELTLKVETDMVSVATFYRNLEHPHIEGRSPPRHNPDQSASVKVDIKKFVKFLYSYQVSPQNVICCIVENQALVLHVLLDDLFLTYYIPVLTTDK